MQDIYVRAYHGFDERGMIISEIQPTGIMPRCIHQLHEHGVDLPPSFHEAARRGPASTGNYG
jgi:pilus assembly protein CpaF